MQGRDGRLQIRLQIKGDVRLLFVTLVDGNLSSFAGPPASTCRMPGLTVKKTADAKLHGSCGRMSGEYLAEHT